MPFACSICEEESTRICVHCTKDTCSNHLCDKCGCCSDCCGCEVPLDEHNHAEPMHVETVHPQPVYAEPEPMAATPIEAASEPLRQEPEPLHPPEPTPAEIMHVEPPRPDSEPQPPHPPPDPDPIPEDGPEPEPGPLLA